MLHLLIMVPAVALIIRWAQPGSAAALFGLTILAVLPVTYAIAWLLHLGIERPGIRLGRLCAGRLQRRPDNHVKAGSTAPPSATGDADDNSGDDRGSRARVTLMDLRP
ncbi:MAG: hypothetical protein IPK59_22255 [Rhodospirillaceae bacterium]|nr:hypothetical protein [Rhodospirillaceae bacterium]